VSTAFERAFELAKSLLPDEWGVKIEVLVEVLLEERIAVSSEQKHAIVVAMEAMGLERHQSEIAVNGGGGAA
jgi:hypothetical protein